MLRLIFFPLLALMFYGFSQGNNKDSDIRFLKVELGFQGLGVSEEYQVKDNWRISAFGGLGGGYRIFSDGLDYRVYPAYPSAYLGAQVKHNYDRKNVRKKNLQLYNVNYFGVLAKYTTKTLSGSEAHLRGLILMNNSFIMNVHWGLQRMFKKRFLWNAYLGVGHIKDFYFEENTIYPSIGFSISYLTFRA